MKNYKNLAWEVLPLIKFHKNVKILKIGNKFILKLENNFFFALAEKSLTKESIKNAIEIFFNIEIESIYITKCFIKNYINYNKIHIKIKTL